MGAVESSQKEFTTCCTARDEYARPEWTRSLVTTPKEIHDAHCEEWKELGKTSFNEPQNARPWERSRQPEGMQLQQRVLEGPALPKLPDNVVFYNSQLGDSIKKSLVECECPARGGREPAQSMERFFCEVCKKPTSSARLGAFLVCSMWPGHSRAHRRQP
jgi:hypothetical protein